MTTNSPVSPGAASSSTTSGATPTTPRGLWRRTTLESYCTEKPEWDVLIDVDAPRHRERREMGVGRAHVLRPRDGSGVWRHVLVSLARGADATVTCEFDLVTREWWLPKTVASTSRGEVDDKLARPGHRLRERRLRRSPTASHR